MTIHAGTVLDPYDDNFQSLRRFFNGRPVPDFIKTASILTHDQHARLPDHAFAVVMIDKQDRPLRKFACTDKAHTAVNVMYFLKAADDIPPPAKVKTAANLLRACRHFGLQPPVALIKAAADAKKRLIKTDGADVRVPVVGREKEADVSGTNIAPITAPLGRAKIASVMGSPYVRLDEPYLPDRSMSKTAHHSVFPGWGEDSWPLNDYTDIVKTAAKFDELANTLHPRDRHKICTKIASRADALGVPVSDVIRKYGSTEWAADGEREAMLATRQQVWASAGNEEGPNLLGLLIEKRASLSPEMFADALAEIDAQTGIDHYWDRGVADPWMTSLGISKQASEWSWSDGKLRVTESQIKKLATDGALQSKFGNSLASGLASNPSVIFDSLPLDTKQVIASMAQE